MSNHNDTHIHPKNWNMENSNHWCRLTKKQTESYARICRVQEHNSAANVSSQIVHFRIDMILAIRFKECFSKYPHMTLAAIGDPGYD
jgi:hypothetical protein